MEKKPVNLKNYLNGAIVLLLLAIAAWHFIIPHSLEKTMPDFDPHAAEECIVYAYDNEVIPPLTVNYTDYIFSFDTGSEEYKGLIELLEGTKYRKQFGNLIDTHSQKITLKPRADMVFVANGITYEIRLFGRDMAMGTERNSKDYSPRGGQEFQESIVDYIFEKAELVSKTER